MTTIAPWAEVEVRFDAAAAQAAVEKSRSALIVRLIGFVVTPIVCFVTMWIIDREITSRAWQLAGFMAAFGGVFLVWSLAVWIRDRRALRAAAVSPLLVTRTGVTQDQAFLPWSGISRIRWRRGRVVIEGQNVTGVTQEIAVATRYLITKQATLDGIFESMSGGICGIEGMNRSRYSVFADNS